MIRLLILWKKHLLKALQSKFSKYDEYLRLKFLFFVNRKKNDGMYDENDLIQSGIEDIILSKKEWPSSNLIKPALKEEYAKSRDA